MKNHHRKIQPIWPLECNFHWAAPRPCQSTRHNVRGCVCPSQKFLFRTGTGMTMIGSKVKTILLMFSIDPEGQDVPTFLNDWKLDLMQLWLLVSSAKTCISRETNYVIVSLKTIYFFTLQYQGMSAPYWGPEVEVLSKILDAAGSQECLMWCLGYWRKCGQ